MIKISNLKPGDIVLADFEGQLQEVTITQVDLAQGMANVDNGVQEFWFEPDALRAIPLDEVQLLNLGFDKEVQSDGSVKYLKGPFRVLLPRAGEFGNFEIWYREDRRHLTAPISVHELQNHYLQMTKVELGRN